MPPLPARDERDGDELPRLVLSMRTKVSIVGLCFVLGMGFFVYTNVPYAVEALRGIGSDGSPEGMQEYVTLFRDDFDVQNPRWNSFNYELSEDVIFRDGFMYLFFSGNSQTNANDLSEDINIPHPWLYANLEIRLKINDDYSQGNNGRGSKWWGYKDTILEYTGPLNFLKFTTYSQQSDSPFRGLWAQSGILPPTWDIENGAFTNEKINLDEFKLDEWHTYRIIWEPQNGTMIIDGETVATTDTVPSTPMAITFQIHSLCRYGSDWEGYNYQYMPFEDNLSIQVDYVHVFVNKEHFEEMDAEISDFLNAAQVQIQELNKRGENTSHLNQYFNQVRDLWKEGHYLYVPARSLLVPFMEVLYNYDTIMGMFLEAETICESLSERQALFCNADLQKARNYWEDCDYKSTNSSLQKILSSVPESSAVTVLSLFISSAFLIARKHCYGK